MEPEIETPEGWEYDPVEETLTFDCSDGVLDFWLRDYQVHNEFWDAERLAAVGFRKRGKEWPENASELLSHQMGVVLRLVFEAEEDVDMMISTLVDLKEDMRGRGGFAEDYYEDDYEDLEEDDYEDDYEDLEEDDYEDDYELAEALAVGSGVGGEEEPDEDSDFQKRIQDFERRLQAQSKEIEELREAISGGEGIHTFTPPTLY